MKKQYVYSFDGDYYDSELYDTREEAIDVGIKEAKKEKYLYFYLLSEVDHTLKILKPLMIHSTEIYLLKISLVFLWYS